MKPLLTLCYYQSKLKPLINQMEPIHRFKVMLPKTSNETPRVQIIKGKGIKVRQAALRRFELSGGLNYLSLFLFTFSKSHSIEKVGQLFFEWKRASETENKIISIQIPTSNKLGKQLNDFKKQLIIKKIQSHLIDAYRHILRFRNYV